MTPQTCQAYCAGKNFPVAGVEYGTQCYCGLALPQTATLDNDGCTMACSGDTAQTCGGRSRLSVYQNASYVPARVVQHTTSPAASDWIRVEVRRGEQMVALTNPVFLRR